MPIDGPPGSASGDASSGPAVAGEPDAALTLAQTLARLKEEQATAAEDAKTRERQLEETLQNAQQARFSDDLEDLGCGVGGGTWKDGWVSGWVGGWVDVDGWVGLYNRSV